MAFLEDERDDSMRLSERAASKKLTSSETVINRRAQKHTIHKSKQMKQSKITLAVRILQSNLTVAFTKNQV